jgi:hypothetical protein
LGEKGTDHFAIKTHLSRNSPRAQDVATRFMLKTGNLELNPLEKFPHLKKNAEK